MKPNAIFIVLLFCGGLSILWILHGAHQAEGPKETDDYVQIVTPDGRPGVYCKDMTHYNGGSDRRDCYKFVSKVCRNGYTFVRESDYSLMVECKAETF